MITNHFLLKILHYLYKLKREKYLIAEKETQVAQTPQDSVFFKLKSRHHFDSFKEAYDFMKEKNLKSYHKDYNPNENYYYFKDGKTKTSYHLSSGFTPLEQITIHRLFEK